MFSEHALTAPWTLVPMTTNLAKAREWLQSWTDVSRAEGILYTRFGVDRLTTMLSAPLPVTTSSVPAPRAGHEESCSNTRVRSLQSPHGHRGREPEPVRHHRDARRPDPCLHDSAPRHRRRRPSGGLGQGGAPLDGCQHRCDEDRSRIAADGRRRARGGLLPGQREPRGCRWSSPTSTTSTSPADQRVPRLCEQKAESPRPETRALMRCDMRHKRESSLLRTDGPANRPGYGSGFGDNYQRRPGHWRWIRTASDSSGRSPGRLGVPVSLDVLIATDQAR